MEDEDKKLTHRQKQRMVKREQKKVVQKAKLKEKRAQQPQQRKQKKYNSDSEPEEEEELVKQQAESSEEEVPQLVPIKQKKQKSNGYTDDNKDWLKLKSKKQQQQKKPESDEEQVDEEEEEEESENELEASDVDEEDDDKLPIERENKKLKKRLAKEAKLADEEMQMTVDQSEIFQLPEAGKEIDEEMSLQDVQQRIKDITQVLTDFGKYRQEGRDRSEYVDQLRRDLCLYYSYNEFLMAKLMDIFKLSDLLEYLEASEVG